MNNMQLNPCPKCGHIPDIEDPDFFHPVTRSGTVYAINCYDGYDGCDYQIITRSDSKEKAVSLWNSKKHG